MLIAAKIKAGSEKFAVVLKGGVLRISLTEPAEKNRANTELVKHLSRMFGGCRIVRGLQSRTKLLELPVRPEELKAKLLIA